MWIAGADFAGAGLGYIDGAIRTGRQAAANAIGELQSRREADARA
jgi:monoamine oxidase